MTVDYQPLTRSKNGKTIKIFPIEMRTEYGIINVSTGETLTPEQDVEIDENKTYPIIGGFRGCNIVFPTSKTLKDVFKSFEGWLSEIEELRVSWVDGWPYVALADFEKQYVGSDIDGSVRFVQDETSTLPGLWYEKGTSVARYGDAAVFVLNVSLYDEALFDVSYSLTSYPLGEKDKDWIKRFFQHDSDCIDI